MSPYEQALIERVQRRAAAMRPDLQRRYLLAFEIIRSTMPEAELTRAGREGTLDRLLDDLLSDRALDRPLAPLRSMVDRMALDASNAWSAFLPSRAQTGVFDVLNPRVIDAVRELDTRVMGGIKAEVRETVRQAAQAGLEAGIHPREVARSVRGTIGLAPNQEAAIRNFRRMLIDGDREALTRALRDRRLDRTLQKALGADGKGLSPEQIEKMTEAYRKRMVAFNAETHARSIALDTQRLAQRMSWQNAIDQGSVDATRLRRIWVTVGDDRVRPAHVEMDGQQVRWGERWSNGQDLPGDSEYNCRCLERIILLPAAQLPRLAA